MAFHIKKVVEKQHPNIYKLVNVIKNEAVITRMKMATFESGLHCHQEEKIKKKKRGYRLSLSILKKEVVVSMIILKL